MSLQTGAQIPNPVQRRPGIKSPSTEAPTKAVTIRLCASRLGTSMQQQEASRAEPYEGREAATPSVTPTPGAPRSGPEGRTAAMKSFVASDSASTERVHRCSVCLRHESATEWSWISKHYYETFFESVTL